jgi:hypothetical protein
MKVNTRGHDTDGQVISCVARLLCPLGGSSAVDGRTQLNGGTDPNSSHRTSLGPGCSFPFLFLSRRYYLQRLADNPLKSPALEIFGRFPDASAGRPDA